MNIIRRVGAAIADRIVRSKYFDDLLKVRSDMIRVGGSTSSGINVNESTAMRFSAVYASIRTIAETKASLPQKVFEVRSGGKSVETRMHPVAELLGVEPNPDHTPMIFEETQMCHLLSTGNRYAEISWNLDAEAYRLTLLHPSTVTPYRGDDGSIWYRIEDHNGVRRRDRSQILHIPGLGGDGLLGWSPIRMHAEAIGIGLANEKFAGLYFKHGAKPTLIVSHPGQLDGPKMQEIRESVEGMVSGDKALSALVLEGGMTGSPVSINLNEAQFLESRKFQGEEIAARCYRLPPHVVGYLDHATFSNIEQQDLYFEKHTMRPWMIRDEQEKNRKLFRRGDRKKYYIKTNTDALLRGATKERYESHQIALLSGFKTINEVRALEELDPVEGGDQIVLAQSIYGKPGSDDGIGEARSRDGFRTLLTRTHVGLIHRELTMVERAAKQPDEYRAKVRDFYERHRRHVAERLAGVLDDVHLRSLDDQLTRHRDALLEAGPDHAADTCARWTDDAERFVNDFLEPE